MRITFGFTHGIEIISTIMAKEDARPAKSISGTALKNICKFFFIKSGKF